MEGRTPMNDSDRAEYPEVQTMPEPIPPLSPTGMLSPFVVFPAAVPALVAAFSPTDVLDRNAIARSLVEWVQQHAPRVFVHAKSTAFEQVDQLVSSSILIVIPIIAICFHFMNRANYPRLRAMRKVDPMSVGQHVWVLSAAFFLPATLAIALMLGGDPSWANGATTRHRGGFYIFVSFMLPLLNGWAFGIQWTNLKLFFETHGTNRISK